MTTSMTNSTKICQRCGESFGCEAMNQTMNQETRCWCQDVPTVKNIPKQYKDCLCPDCLTALAKAETEIKTKAHGAGTKNLIEGEDFYYEKGLHVFTRKYHLDKGYCCNSGCRHCPYMSTN